MKIGFLLLLAVSAWIPCAQGAFSRPVGIEHLEDAGGRMNADDVIKAPSEHWEKVETAFPQFGYTRSHHWLRFRIEEEGNSHQSMVISVPFAYIENLSLYVVQAGKVLYRSDAGLSIPYSKREKNEYHASRFTFRIAAPRDPATQYYLEADGTFPLAIPVITRGGNIFVGAHGDRQLFLGLFFGSLAFAFLFNSFLAIALRSTIYGYYSAYVLFLSLLMAGHHGFAQLYLWPESPWLAFESLHFSGALALVFYVLFVDRFLSVAKFAPRLRMLLFFLTGISLLRAILFLVGDWLIVGQVGETAVIATNLLVLLIAMVGIYRRAPSARLFFFSAFVFNVGYFLFMLQIQYAHFIPAWPWMEYLPHFGIAIEVALLSLALADRIRRTNVELAGSYASLDREARERARVESALGEQRRAVMQTEKLGALGRMAAGIAHEINNPLAIIHGNAVLLRESAADERVREMASTIEQTAKRISKIVKSMRTLSRDSKNDPKQEVPIAEIMADALAISSERFRLGKVELSLSEPIPEGSVACRRSEIAQVLLNLLNNAFDATEGYGRWVRLEAVNGLHEVEFAVIDDGPGVAPEDFERIQEPFFTTKEVGRGTGLGLSISRSIVAGHGGQFFIGRGRPTRIGFTLPKPDSPAAAFPS